MNRYEIGAEHGDERRVSNKRDHDFLTHPKRFKDFNGSFDRMNNARSSGMWSLTFFSPDGLAIVRRESKAESRRQYEKDISI